jgi:hypothetical protein
MGEWTLLILKAAVSHPGQARPDSSDWPSGLPTVNGAFKPV